MDIGNNLATVIIIASLVAYGGLMMYLGYNHGTATAILGIIMFILGIPVGAKVIPTLKENGK